MGIARGAVALLLNEARQRPFTGTLATLGRQAVIATAKEVEREFRRFGFEPPHEPCDDIALFKQMGFGAVESFDYSAYEGATYTLDLNQEGLPEQYVGAFDVMLDSGTVEHVFNIGHALVNAVSMVKVGGRAIFLTPASNYMDHGFYTPSPSLFFEFFTVNGWRIDTLNLVRHSTEIQGRFRTYAYTPEFGRLLTMGLGSLPYLVLVVATRLPSSSTDRVPQQKAYISAWGGRETTRHRSAWRERTIKALEYIPGATRLALPAWHTLIGANARRRNWTGDF